MQIEVVNCNRNPATINSSKRKSNFKYEGKGNIRKKRKILPITIKGIFAFLLNEIFQDWSLSFLISSDIYLQFKSVESQSDPHDYLRLNHLFNYL